MIIKKCLTCGKEFKTYPCKIKVGKGKFCSTQCYQTTIIKKCLICGNKFKTNKSIIKDGKGKFCSRKCNGIWHSKNLRVKNGTFW